MDSHKSASHAQCLVAGTDADGGVRKLWLIYNALTPGKHAAIVDYVIGASLPPCYWGTLAVLPHITTSKSHYDFWLDARCFPFQKRHGPDYRPRVALPGEWQPLSDYYGDSGSSHIGCIKGPNSTGQIQNLMYVLYRAVTPGAVEPQAMQEYTVLPGGPVLYPEPVTDRALIYFDQIRTIRKYYDSWQYRLESLQHTKVVS